VDKTIQVKQPLVPYIKYSLNLLETLEKTQLDNLEHGMINFDKRRSLVQVMDQLKQMQSLPYKLLPVFQIASRLKLDALSTEEEEEEEEYLICK